MPSGYSGSRIGLQKNSHPDDDRLPQRIHQPVAKVADR